MLHEEVRRYRHRVGEQEAALGAQGRALVSARNEAARLQRSLRECCSVAPRQLLQEREFRQALADR